MILVPMHFMLLKAGLLATAVTLIGVVSFNELTTAASLCVFVALVTSFLALVFATGRPALISTIVVASLGSLITINEVKYHLLREMLHPIDLFLLASWISTGDQFILAYSDIALVALLSLILLAISLWAAWRIDRTWAKRWRDPASASMCLTSATARWVALGAGTYFASAANLSFYHQLTVNTGLRASYVVAAFQQIREMYAELQLIDRGQGLGRRYQLAECIECPDLVIFHAESVFDPNILRSYSEYPSLGNHINSGLTAVSGKLKTNVFGGRSMISEFELLCGINHARVGYAGNYPNLFLQPFLGKCAPTQLSEIGYRTTVFYTTPADQNHAGNMFKAYGFQDFRDPTSLQLPARWDLMRDTPLIDETLRILRMSSEAPRLIYVSSMFNHGPHGAERIDEEFPGPYSLNPAENGQARDYINRLNHTLTELERLERVIQSLPRKTALLVYGDHQPSLPITYAEQPQRLHGPDLKFITVFRIATNWQSHTSAALGATADVVPIEDLMGVYLKVSEVIAPEAPVFSKEGI